jgi:hypothetical protein
MTGNAPATHRLDGESSREACRTNREQLLRGSMPELPPRYAFRLEDLRAWHLVEASCRRCRHRALIAHAALRRGRPPYIRLFDLERTLRCRRCGSCGEASPAIRLQGRN